MSFPIPVQLSVAESNVPVNVTISEQEGVSLGVSAPIERTMTQAEWQALMNDKADIIISSATGEIASFPDGANNLPVVSLAAGVNPVQDFHGYGKPWAAGTGRNKLAYPYYHPTRTNNGITYTVHDDGSITLTGEATGNSVTAVVYNQPLPNGSYVFSLSEEGGSYTGLIYIRFQQHSTDTHVNLGADEDKSFTVDDGNFYLIQIRTNSTTKIISPVTVYPMFRLSTDTDTTWEPYANVCPISGSTGVDVYVSPTQDQQDATTYAEDWTSQAGTVYGGTVNLTTGELTVDRVIFETTWSAGSNATTYGDCTIKRFSYTVADDKSKKEQAICNVASYITNDTSAEWAKGSVFSLHNSNKLLYLSLPTNTPSTQAIQLCYYLATPVTYQLTAQEVKTLLGQNYVWSNNGGVIAITYRADTKLYIDNKIAQAIAAAL